MALHIKVVSVLDAGQDVLQVTGEAFDPEVRLPAEARARTMALQAEAALAALQQAADAAGKAQQDLASAQGKARAASQAAQDAGNELAGAVRSLEATGWVSATTQHFGPESLGEDGNRLEDAQPAAMTPAQVGAYALGLLVEQNGLAPKTEIGFVQP